MTIRWTIGTAALALAAHALAQTARPAPPPPPPPAAFVAAPLPPVDPVRLAAARPVIDRIWATGTYARVMHTMMDQFVQGSMARMMAMKPDDLLAGFMPPPKPDKAGAPKPPSETLGEMAYKKDPYFQQRMTLTMRVVGDEMARVMTQVEPGVRDALAHAYARRFTVAQLGELDRFFATPTGAAYAADSTTLMMSPEMGEAMQGLTPLIIKAIPDIGAKIAEATKSLPPVPSARKAPPVVMDPAPPRKSAP